VHEGAHGLNCEEWSHFMGEPLKRLLVQSDTFTALNIAYVDR
jgi:hypothetical protein